MFALGFRRAVGSCTPVAFRSFSSLHFFKSHEWLQVEGQKGRLGITDHAQGLLGEIVYVDLPGVGDQFDSKGTIVTLESVKAVGEVYAPANLVVTGVNEALEDEANATLVNKKAETDGWLLEVELKGDLAPDAMTLAEYKQFCEDEEH